MFGEGNTRRGRVVPGLPILAGGGCLCLLLLAGWGRSQAPPVPLPSCVLQREQGPVNTVSLAVAKAVNLPVRSQRLLESIEPVSALPAQVSKGVVGRVSIQVSKRVDTTELVCVRVLNGLSVNVEYGAFAFCLHKWEEQEGKFLHIEDPDLRGTAVQLGAYLLPAGGIVDRYLPSSRQPAPSGSYRVRFRFRPPGQEVAEEVSSEGLSRP